MSTKDYKRWHLAEDEQETRVTEFEFLLWRVFYGFLRWQEDNQKHVCKDDLNGYEIALLHVIKMNDRAKTLSEVGRLLNRDDAYNIKYGVKKLVKLGLVEKTETKTSKEVAYETTEKGANNIRRYTDARKDILISLFSDFDSAIDLEGATKTLNIVKGIYEEASRGAALYTSPKKE